MDSLKRWGFIIDILYEGPLAVVMGAAYAIEEKKVRQKLQSSYISLLLVSF